ncbi:CaiB/BaiF CoA transferase family protein [Rhodococcus sp. NPDC059968]|uniref:CaiB/BaiF CoA transferase family protein n=1 Tax=Rhodococcus sp. NPDC059968 TaxID=3347017 RepID=UPI00366C26D9
MSPDGKAPGPLAGLRVVDLTRVIVGPYATQFLGDMGADVIKVESPVGDLTRSVGAQRHADMSANFLIFNRNKRSIVLDLKHPEGQEALRRLIETADVFVVNYRPAALAKLNITYEDLTAINPGLVYCRVVGYGADNPNNAKPAIDDVIQALTGSVALQGELTGHPSFVGLPMADLTCGLFALGGILGALYRKSRTGEGDEVEVRMYDSMAAFNLSPHLAGESFVPALGPARYPRSVSPNRKPFDTADGVITVAPYTDKAWRSFLPLIGRAELLDDPRYATVHARSSHLNELYEIMIPVIKTKTSDEWLRLLEEADVPCSKVQTPQELVEDQALASAGLLTEHEHPTEGRIRLLNNPVRYTNAPNSIRQLPANLGEHSREILDEVGFSADEIDAMVTSGTTVIPPVTAGQPS